MATRLSNGEDVGGVREGGLSQGDWRGGNDEWGYLTEAENEKKVGWPKQMRDGARDGQEPEEAARGEDDFDR
jgi:hypothetical protein